MGEDVLPSRDGPRAPLLRAPFARPRTCPLSALTSAFWSEEAPPPPSGALVSKSAALSCASSARSARRSSASLRCASTLSRFTSAWDHGGGVGRCAKVRGGGWGGGR